MVGVLVTDVTTANYPEILFHLGHEIQATGSRMLVFAVPRDDGAGAALADLLAYHVDGIVSCVSMPEPMLETCERHRVPVVLYNRIPRGALASAVGCDHTTAMADLPSTWSLAGSGARPSSPARRGRPSATTGSRAPAPRWRPAGWRSTGSSRATTPTRAPAAWRGGSAPRPTGPTPSFAPAT
jgi:hypothetical protein